MNSAPPYSNTSPFIRLELMLARDIDGIGSSQSGTLTRAEALFLTAIAVANSDAELRLNQRQLGILLGITAPQVSSTKKRLLRKKFCSELDCGKSTDDDGSKKGNFYVPTQAGLSALEEFAQMWFAFPESVANAMQDTEEYIVTLRRLGTSVRTDLRKKIKNVKNGTDSSDNTQAQTSPLENPAKSDYLSTTT